MTEYQIRLLDIVMTMATVFLVVACNGAIFFLIVAIRYFIKEHWRN